MFADSKGGGVFVVVAVVVPAAVVPAAVVLAIVPAAVVPGVVPAAVVVVVVGVHPATDEATSAVSSKVAIFFMFNPPRSKIILLFFLRTATDHDKTYLSTGTNSTNHFIYTSL